MNLTRSQLELSYTYKLRRNILNTLSNGDVATINEANPHSMDDRLCFTIQQAEDIEHSIWQYEWGIKLRDKLLSTRKW